MASSLNTNILVYLDDDPLAVLYDDSPFLTPTPGSTLFDLIFRAAETQLNRAIIEQRRQEAVKEALPFMELASSLDAPADLAGSFDQIFSSPPLSFNIKQITALPFSKFPEEILERQQFVESGKLDAEKLEGLLVVIWSQSMKESYSVSAKSLYFLRGIEKPVYRNNYWFKCGSEDGADWQNWWADNGGIRFRTAYLAGIQALPQVLALDFAGKQPELSVENTFRTEQGYLVTTCSREIWRKNES